MIRPPPRSTLFPYTTLFRSPIATAALDVRLLPGQDPAAFLADLVRVVGDTAVTFRPQGPKRYRSEEHTSELQSHSDLVCRLLLEKKNKKKKMKCNKSQARKT